MHEWRSSTWQARRVAVLLAIPLCSRFGLAGAAIALLAIDIGMVHVCPAGDIRGHAGQSGASSYARCLTGGERSARHDRRGLACSRDSAPWRGASADSSRDRGHLVDVGSKRFPRSILRRMLAIEWT